MSPGGDDLLASTGESSHQMYHMWARLIECRICSGRRVFVRGSSPVSHQRTPKLPIPRQRIQVHKIVISVNSSATIPFPEEKKTEVHKSNHPSLVTLLPKDFRLSARCCCILHSCSRRDLYVLVQSPVDLALLRLTRCLS